MRGHLFLYNSSRSSSLLKTSYYLFNPSKLCSCEASDKHGESKAREFIKERERAPSTAQEFQRVAEEKMKETTQSRFRSEKVKQATEEATHDDSKVGSVKER